VRFVFGAFLVCTTLPSYALAQDGPLHRAIARAASTAVPERDGAVSERHDASGWAAVVRLQAGTKVTLTYADGVSEDRVFVGANDTKLMVRSASGQDIAGEIIAREKILVIGTERRHRDADGALSGAGAGLVIGLPMSALATGDSPGTSGDQRVLAGLAWVGLGAFLGYHMAPVHVRREIIYRAGS
jgi:hypothetical protein